MTSEAQLRTMLGTPGMDPAESATLVLDAAGKLAGAGVVFHEDPHVVVHAWGLISEAHHGLGIGTFLHNWVVKQASAATANAPAEARLAVRQRTLNGDRAAEAFLRKAGYTQTRHYWRMLIELDAPPPAPQWPEGIAPDAFDPRRDLRAAALASREAFQDHYGFVAGSLESELEKTRHYIESDPGFEPALWFLARDIEENTVAGLCLCAPAEAGDRTTAYVQNLGVRPAWRRRGIGRALLLHAFGQIYRRGTSRIALYVDAQSLTGATRLYESVGMKVGGLSHEHELQLRPGVDLAVRGRRTAGT